MVALSAKLLDIHGCVFLPFAASCDRQGRNIVCNYEDLKRHIRLSNELFAIYGRSIKCIAIHTEYQAPIWFDKVFIENYVKFTIDIIQVALTKCSDLKIVEIELHPGFSDHLGSRRPWDPIIEGMAHYLSRVYDTSKRNGIVLRATVENRGSSALKQPQAVANLYELRQFRELLEAKLAKEGINLEVGLTIDPLQLLSLRKNIRDKRRALEEALRESEALAKDNGALVHSIHIHWISEKGRTHTPPPPNEIGIAVERFKRIINYVLCANGEAYVVPEIVPMYVRKPETQHLLEELAKALNIPL